MFIRRPAPPGSMREPAPNPSGHEGLTDIRTVFISHPFSSDPGRNQNAIAVIARRLARNGVLPLAPQLYLPHFLDEATERDLALRLCLRLVGLADEVQIFGSPSEGMKLEIAEARRLGIPIVDGRQPNAHGEASDHCL